VNTFVVVDDNNESWTLVASSKERLAFNIRAYKKAIRLRQAVLAVLDKE